MNYLQSLLKRYDADILQVFIEQLCQRDHLPSINPIISGSDFRNIFQKTKEFTSSSPLGIHIDHYKLATQSKYLSDIHATFMSLPFQYGFSLKRWQKSTHVMLPKMNKPYIHKLRIIQLFEGDFNAALKILYAR